MSNFERVPLDTNIVSMLSPSASVAPAPFLDWLERMDGEGRLFRLTKSNRE